VMAAVTAPASIRASPTSTTGAGSRCSLDHQDLQAISPGTLRRLRAAGPRGRSGYSIG
jgi:hypothetical protein